MEGITVLNTTPEQAGDLMCILPFTFALIFFVLFIVATVYAITHQDSLAGCLIALAATAIFFTIGWAGATSYTPARYQVIIDETVSFKEFAEKYEIIKVEGEIYTIQEVQE